MQAKRGAVMQPYFLPYIGYWQLIQFSDVFVVYDNIQFTKKGWINRNRILVNGKDQLFSVPVKKDSDYLNVNERYLADSYLKQNQKTLRVIEASYRKAPFFSEAFPLIESCFTIDKKNLFDFIYQSICSVTKALEIDTQIIKSSEIDISPELKGKDRVIETCKAIGVDQYINPIGGVELYEREEFRQHGIDLLFQKVDSYNYMQFENEFVPHLSIIDVLMFNGLEGTKLILDKMTVV